MNAQTVREFRGWWGSLTLAALCVKYVTTCAWARVRVNQAIAQSQKPATTPRSRLAGLCKRGYITLLWLVKLSFLSIALILELHWGGWILIHTCIRTYRHTVVREVQLEYIFCGNCLLNHRRNSISNLVGGFLLLVLVFLSNNYVFVCVIQIYLLIRRRLVCSLFLWMNSEPCEEVNIRPDWA